MNCIPMNQKVKRVGIKRESGYFYFVDREGDISRYKLSQNAIYRRIHKVEHSKNGGK